MAGEVYNVGGWNEKPNIEIVRTVCALLDELRPRADGQSYATQVTYVKDRPGHDRRYAIDANRRNPAMIAGDFNLNASEGPASAALKAAGFWDAIGHPDVPTRPRRGLFDPGRAIDWVFVSSPLRSTKGQVHDSVRASDHFPISLTLFFA